MVALTIPIAPRTKKTSNAVVFKRVATKTLPSGFCTRCRRAALPIVLPSEAFRDFQATALPHLRRQWRGRPPIAAPVCVNATFYREALRGDLVGYMQALADVLEAAGVLVNDRLIVAWDGTRMEKDAARPRIEIEIAILDESDQLTLPPPPEKP